MYDHPLSVVERDLLGLVRYPGEACDTLTTNSRYTWVGGPEAGDGGFLTAAEMAYYMGVCGTGGAFAAAQLWLTEARLEKCLVS